MNDDWIDKIEDYLSGNMSGEDRLLFESEVAADPELSSTFKIYQVIDTEMRAAEKYRRQDAALKEVLANLKADYLHTEGVLTAQTKTIDSTKPQPAGLIPEEIPSSFPTPGPVKLIGMNWKKRLAIAAGFIGIVLLGLIWYTGDNKEERKVVLTNKKTDSPGSRPEQLQNTGLPDTSSGKAIPPESIARQNVDTIANPEKIKGKKRMEIRITGKEREALYAGNFQPDTAPAKKAGPLQEALAYYETGEYDNAAIAFERVDVNRVARGEERNKKQTAFYAHYYKGLSYMADHKAAKAIPELEKALANSPDRFSTGKAKWYLALACLKTGQLKRAEILLTQLAASNGAYQQKSRGLARKIGSGIGD